MTMLNLQCSVPRYNTLCTCNDQHITLQFSFTQLQYCLWTTECLRQLGNRFSKDRAGINPIQHLWWMRWCWISIVNLPLPKHHSANAPHASTTTSITRSWHSGTHLRQEWQGMVSPMSWILTYSNQKPKYTCTLFKDLTYYTPYKIIR